MKKYLFILLASFIGFISYSQTTVQSILGQDIKQGEKLLEAYFTPMAESFSATNNRFIIITLGVIIWVFVLFFI